MVGAAGATAVGRGATKAAEAAGGTGGADGGGVGGGAVKVGLGVEVGTTNFGGAAGGGGLGGFGSGALTTGGAAAKADLVSTGTGAVAGGAAAATGACCLLMMAFRASPGLEICERSILVLMPSSPCGAREVLAELGAASERPRRCLRTSSAS